MVAGHQEHWSRVGRRKALPGGPHGLQSRRPGRLPLGVGHPPAGVAGLKAGAQAAGQQARE